MVMRPVPPLCLAAAILSCAVVSAQNPTHVFKTSDTCMACHNGLRTPSGEDVSIGLSWRASMMANASRDPYWRAAVRREVLDHPAAAAAIEDECAVCHMPMSRTAAHLAGEEGKVFASLEDPLASDGVSCSLCHQITSTSLGSPESFTGGYVLSGPATQQPRPMFGPFQIERGLSTIMRSATTFQPTEATHLKESELCATCHTLVTKARGPDGAVIGELPEQMPYLEWKHSAFAGEQRSCQSCHMPVVDVKTPIASVLGSPRDGLSRHSFVGGNFFVLRMLDRFRAELQPAGASEQMKAAVAATMSLLQNSTAEVAIDRAVVSGDRLVADVVVRNLTGHKLPTGYPSRRAWLHVALRDRNGRVVFESGAIAPDGSIAGNDHDRDAGFLEPHYTEITRPDQVQIYESIMGDPEGRPTTGLLKAVRYLKDNRLLPRGFDKSTADPWIAVFGDAAGDGDFVEERDRVRYAMPADPAAGPFQLDVALRFQVIGFRWADNLRAYRAEETSQFVKYYDSMASSSSEVLASSRAFVSAPTVP